MKQSLFFFRQEIFNANFIEPYLIRELQEPKISEFSRSVILNVFQVDQRSSPEKTLYLIGTIEYKNKGSAFLCKNRSLGRESLVCDQLSGNVSKLRLSLANFYQKIKSSGNNLQGIIVIWIHFRTAVMSGLLHVELSATQYQLWL